MCGRFACPLAPDNLSRASSYKKKSSGLYVRPTCIFDFKSFIPSYNIPPTSISPVIISTVHKICEETVTNDRIIVPMRFGVVPCWLAPGEFRPGQSETHLLAIERIDNTSKLYNHIVNHGGRCVIPCLGFYEWQSTKGLNKQPYFFYNEKNNPTELTNVEGDWDENLGWQGIKLLYLAGVFTTYMNEKGEKQYAFAILTQEADENWKWVHHRMPVVLQSEEDIDNWIRMKWVPIELVLKSLNKPIRNLKAHPVDRTKVNSTKNNSPQCVVELELNKPTSKLMQSWLKSGQDTGGAAKVQPKHGSTSKMKLKKKNLSSKKIMDDFLLRPNKKE